MNYLLRTYFNVDRTQKTSMILTMRNPILKNGTNPRENIQNGKLAKTDVQAYGESRQVVYFNWNSGRCNSVACWRTHICSGCGGKEPRITCARCNAAKG